MLRFLAFAFSRDIYKAWSPVVAAILRLKGVVVGKNFYIEGVPYLKVRGRFENIRIGDNVKIFGNIDLRNRENGRIVIGNDVEIDNDCRFVAANDAVLEFKDKCFIGPYCVFNAGSHITLGSYTISGGFIHIQSSNHGMARGEKIWLQKHNYGPVLIGEDVWLGGGCTILQGVTLADGAVVAAKAVVTNDVPEFSIVAGVPARVIGQRT